MVHICPFGNLNNGHVDRLKGLFKPMQAFNGSEQEFVTLIDTWLDDVATHIWPRWENGNWGGSAQGHFETATREELLIAKQSFQDQDVMNDVPATDPALPEDMIRNNRWHYRIEDALELARFDRVKAPGSQSFEYLASRNVASNFLGYATDLNLTEFEADFWNNIEGLQPGLFDIKKHFGRPRPWTLAAAFQIDDFAWETANGVTHTGVHPSLLSGHCIQGILGGCNVLQTWLTRRRQIPSGFYSALKQYSVDWGDRRVFAGVHYLTDNIASWTLAIRLIPHLFDNGKDEILEFARDAIQNHSLGYKTIRDEFPKSEALRHSLALLDKDLAEASS